MLGRGIIAAGCQYPDEEGIDFKLSQKDFIGWINQKINRVVAWRNSLGDDMGNLAIANFAIGKNTTSFNMLTKVISASRLAFHV